jgi:hypothetical protein
MNGLIHTALPVSQKVDLAILALAGQGQYGAVTQLAREFGISRPTVYSAAETGLDALHERFCDEPSSPASTVAVNERQLERTIIALRVMLPGSLRPIEDLLPVLYPGTCVSYGKIQGILVAAEQRAAQHNRQADLSQVDACAVDEMFSQRRPVLAGVDLDSGYLCALELRESRSAEDWAQVLRQAEQQGFCPRVVVKDAAAGIAAGFEQVFAGTEQRDDCFHAVYEMGKVRRILEQRAYGAMGQVFDIENKIDQAWHTGRGDRVKLRRELRKAESRCKDAIDLHDRFEAASRAAHEAMQFIDLETAQIRTGPQMQQAIEIAAAEMLELDDRRCKKIGKYLKNRSLGLAKYMVDFHGQLAELAKTWGTEPVRLACLAHRLMDELRAGHQPWARIPHSRLLLGAMEKLDEIKGEKAQELLVQVAQLLEHRHRASSAIEGFNAALRPHLYVHKGTTPGFLELFRAYYNLRTRRWGRNKGKSPHECLTGQRIDDWLSFVGYPPATSLN